MILPSDNYALWNNHSALWTMSSFAVFYLLAPWLYRLLKRFSYTALLTTALMFFCPMVISSLENMFESCPEEWEMSLFISKHPLAQLYCFLLGALLYLAVKESRENIYLLVVSAIMACTRLDWYAYELLFVLFLAAAVLLKPLTKKEICMSCDRFYWKRMFYAVSYSSHGAASSTYSLVYISN